MTLDIVSGLGQIPGEQSLQMLVRLLENNDPAVLKAAVHALGEMGRREAVSPLLILLRDEGDKALRREVLKALGDLPSGQAVETLVDALFDEEVETRRESARALSRLFEGEEKIFKSSILKKREAVSSLLKVLADHDPKVRRYAIRALGLSESYRAAVPVTAALNDEDVEVRREAARAAGLLRDRRATLSLATALQDHNEDQVVRVQALFALRRLGSNMAVQALLEAAASQHAETRLDSLRVILAALSDEESILIEREVRFSVLERGMKDNGVEMRSAIVEIAGLLKRHGVERIVAAGMRDEALEVRKRALRATTGLSQSEILRQEVRRLTRDRDRELRKQAVLALSRCSPEAQDIAFLKEVIAGEPEEGMRVAAFSSLLKMSSNSAIPLIRKELDNRTSTIRGELVEILGSTSNRNALGLLLDHLDEHKEVKLQKAAAFSLRRFAKDREVSAALLQVVRDKERDLQVRQAALSVLVDLSKKSHGGGMIFPHFASVLRERGDPLRQDVIGGFASMADERAVDQLLRILEDTREAAATRKLALSALISVAPAKALPEMRKILLAASLGTSMPSEVTQQ